MGNACQATSNKPKKIEPPVIEPTTHIQNSIFVHKKAIEKKSMVRAFDNMGVSLTYSNQGEGNSIQNSAIAIHLNSDMHLDIIDHQQHIPMALPSSLTGREKEIHFFNIMKHTIYHRVLKQILEITLTKSTLNRAGSTELETPALSVQERKIEKISSVFDLLELFLNQNNIKTIVNGDEFGREDEKARLNINSDFCFSINSIHVLGLWVSPNIYSIKMAHQDFYNFNQLLKSKQLLDKIIKELETIIWSSAGRLSTNRKGWFDLVWYKLKTENHFSVFQFFLPEIASEKSEKLCRTLEESLRKRFFSVIKDVSYINPLELCLVDKEKAERLRSLKIEKSKNWNLVSLGESFSITEQYKEMFLTIPKEENKYIGDLTASQTDMKKVGIILFDSLSIIPSHLLCKIGFESVYFNIVISCVAPRTILCSQASNEFHYYTIDNYSSLQVAGFYYRLASE